MNNGTLPRRPNILILISETSGAQHGAVNFLQRFGGSQAEALHEAYERAEHVRPGDD